MGIIKYNPFRPVDFDNLFEDFFGRSMGDHSRMDSASMPSVNVIEKEDSYVVEVAAPGMEKSDFKVEVDNDRLVISAEKKAEKEDKEEGKFTRREFNYTSFTRSFQLSDVVDAEKIEASYNEGILRVNMGKKDTAITKAPKTIEIG